MLLVLLGLATRISMKLYETQHRSLPKTPEMSSENNWFEQLMANAKLQHVSFRRRLINVSKQMDDVPSQKLDWRTCG